jgi:hypothetical protein
VAFLHRSYLAHSCCPVQPNNCGKQNTRSCDEYTWRFNAIYRVSYLSHSAWRRVTKWSGQSLKAQITAEGRNAHWILDDGDYQLGELFSSAEPTNRSNFHQRQRCYLNARIPRRIFGDPKKGRFRLWRRVLGHGSGKQRRCNADDADALYLHSGESIRVAVCDRNCTGLHSEPGHAPSVTPDSLRRPCWQRTLSVQPGHLGSLSS